MTRAIAPVAAEIIPVRPPIIEMMIAIENDAYRPTFGSTPAMIENEIASGMSANATTRPDSRSAFGFVHQTSRSQRDHPVSRPRDRQQVCRTCSPFERLGHRRTTTPNFDSGHERCRLRSQRMRDHLFRDTSVTVGRSRRDVCRPSAVRAVATSAILIGVGYNPYRKFTAKPADYVLVVDVSDPRRRSRRLGVPRLRRAGGKVVNEVPAQNAESINVESVPVIATTSKRTGTRTTSWARSHSTASCRMRRCLSDADRRGCRSVPIRCAGLDLAEHVRCRRRARRGRVRRSPIASCGRASAQPRRR